MSENDVGTSGDFDDTAAEASDGESAAAVSAPASYRDAASPLTDAELAKLAELDEQIAKFEGQKRWSDVIKGVLAKAEIHRAPAQKVELYALAGSMYLEKSSNQAEAIKAYEAVIELDAGNIEAITRLKEMYEKRRDWEKLVSVMKLETALMDESDRAIRYVEMAQLATEKLRKPEICIELWKTVLEFDAENPDALANLAYACLRCNRHKGPNLAGIDRLTLRTKLVRLFNPRRHSWSYHFRWDGPLIVGRTPIGRVTVDLLAMNGPERVALREELIDEGVFPLEE